MYRELRMWWFEQVSLFFLLVGSLAESIRAKNAQYLLVAATSICLLMGFSRLLGYFVPFGWIASNHWKPCAFCTMILFTPPLPSVRAQLYHRFQVRAGEGEG